MNEKWLDKLWTVCHEVKKQQHDESYMVYWNVATTLSVYNKYLTLTSSSSASFFIVSNWQTQVITTCSIQDRQVYKQTYIQLLSRVRLQLYYNYMNNISQNCVIFCFFIQFWISQFYCQFLPFHVIAAFVCNLRVNFCLIWKLVLEWLQFLL